MGLLSELKRRNVLRMAAVYVLAAWLVMQVTEVMMGLANLPVWVGHAILGLLAIGFPIALVFSWVYEITPEGISLDRDADSAEKGAYFSGRRLDFIVISLLCAALLLFAYDKWWTVEPPEQSVAVLPFVNMSGDPAQEHFSDGMAEELMHRLAQISELRVAARTSAFYFKNKNIPISEIGAQLDVRSVLEGSIRKAGNTLRVTAQLINASDGYHIWSKTFERESDDIFAIQDEIATQVVDALKVTLLGNEQARLSRQPTANLAAYEAYLLGRQTMARRTSASLQAAVGHFLQAIEEDPTYALAHVGLADSYILLWRYGALDSNEVLASAEPAIKQALRLDDMLGEAYASLGAVRFVQEDYLGSREAYDRAIELNPNYAPAYDGYGLVLRWAFARKEEGLEFHQAALELDPLSTPINMAVVESYLELGRFDDAMTRCRKIIEIDPDFPRSYTIMADLYWEVFASLDEGVRWLRKAMELDPGNPDHARWLGMIYLDLGDLAAGEYWMDEAIRLAPTQAMSKWAAVYLASYTGDADDVVIAALESLAASPNDGLALVRLRDEDYRDGRLDDALSRFRAVVPDFVDGEDPDVNATNWSWAIETANVLIKVGERGRADYLLNKALSAVKSAPRLGYAGYGISDVEIYALLGDKEKAINALAAAVDAGWRISWRMKTDMNDNLASLHNDPRYRRIIDDLESEMAEQLSRVRTWEATGS